jgi:diketogulonate reductase-like aldo/keto reductase
LVLCGHAGREVEVEICWIKTIRNFMRLTDYRLFGRTGVNVSPLTLGCMMFGGKTDLDESVRIIDRAIDAGINIMDTANVYSRGRSEEFTGEALKRNGRRQTDFSLYEGTRRHG